MLKFILVKILKFSFNLIPHWLNLLINIFSFYGPRVCGRALSIQLCPFVRLSLWPSVALYRLFLRIYSLLFSDFLREVRIQKTTKSHGALFSRKILVSPKCCCFAFKRKIPFIPKMGEISLFWAQNELFRTFLKIYSLKLFEIIPHGRCLKE